MSGSREIESEASDTPSDGTVQPGAPESEAGPEEESQTSESEDAETTTPDIDADASELDRARVEASQNHDRYLRAAAELDNFRKRTVKIRSETREETLRDVLLQVGPLLDNFRRVLGQDTQDLAAYRQGIEIIFKQFNDILEGYGLEEIEAQGQPFDPNLHEAMMQVPTDAHPPGTVVEEMEKGYKLNDRVVRPARVIVSAAKAEDTRDGDGEPDDNEPDDDEPEA